MTHLEIKSRVGADGVLTISLPLGPSEANREVKVTVEPAEDALPPSAHDQDQWRDFLKSTAGSISDPTFQRHQ